MPWQQSAATRPPGIEEAKILAWAREAQAAWPDFVEAFRDPDASSSYLIVANVQNDAGDWWYVTLLPIEIEGGRVRAVINMHKPDLGFRNGDEFEIGEEEVLDWAIATPRGGHTEPLTWSYRGRFSGEEWVLAGRDRP